MGPGLPNKCHLPKKIEDAIRATRAVNDGFDARTRGERVKGRSPARVRSAGRQAAAAANFSVEGEGLTVTRHPWHKRRDRKTPRRTAGNGQSDSVGLNCNGRVQRDMMVSSRGKGTRRLVWVALVEERLKSCQVSAHARIPASRSSPSRAQGALTIFAIPHFATRFTSSSPPHDEPLFAIDLAKVDYLSSSGVAILVGLKRRVETKAWQDRHLPCPADRSRPARRHEARPVLHHRG